MPIIYAEENRADLKVFMVAGDIDGKRPGTHVACGRIILPDRAWTSQFVIQAAVHRIERRSHFYFQLIETDIFI